MRIFVDTNVLFDIFAQREPFVHSAKKLLIMQAFGDAEIWAAPQSYLDVFYLLRKTQSAEQLTQILNTSLQRINLCTTGHDDMRSALNAGWDDVEDALIGLSCRKMFADYLLTRDEKQQGFKNLGIPSLSPESFFERIKDEFGVMYNEIEFSKSAVS